MAELRNSLFHRYSRIMGRTLMGVLVVAGALIWLQADGTIRAEKDVLSQRLRERVLALNVILARTSTGVSTLRSAAEHRFRTNPSIEAASPLMRTLLDHVASGALALDDPPPPWTQTDLGNLTGNAMPLDISRRRELEMALSLNPTLAAIRSNNPSAVWVYYTSVRNFINIFPWVPSATFRFSPALLQKEFVQGGTPAANPQRAPFWTDAYVDEAGKGVMVTAAAPVYEGGTFRGTVALDITLHELNAFLRAQVSRFDQPFIINDAGQLLAHSSVEGQENAILGMEAAFPPALRGAINSLLARSRGQLIRQEGYYVENLALDGTPFRLVLVVHRDTFLLSALRSSLVTAVLLVVTLAMMLVVTTRLTKREFIWPAQQLVSYIEEESQGSAVAIPSVPLAWRPWFSTIRHVFNAHTQLISIQQELDVARRMQQSIVPTRFPKRPDVTVFARMIPAKEVGGDFYDYFWLDDDHIGVVIADVSGKGVPAALFMAVARTLIRATAPGAAMPGRCLALTNDLLSQDNDATMFVTVFYGILNTRSGEMTYANAGHNAPHLVLPDGEVLPLARTGGMAMGVMEGVSYTEGSLVLSPGSTLFLYTDGVTEAFDRHGKEYTEARLLHQLRALRDRPIEQLVEEVIRSVNEFARDVPQADDITCLAIQRPFASAGTETAA